MRIIQTILLSLAIFSIRLSAQVQLEWKPIFTQTNALAFALNPLDDNIIYATKNGVFYVTQDGGNSWDARGLVPTVEIRNIAVCPADTLVILMYANGSLLRSTDGGFNWTEVLIEISMDGETIEFHPAYPDSVFYIDFLGGDLWVSGDRGANWTKRTNVALTHVCSFSINPFDPKKMIAGAGNTRINRSLDGGFTWESVKPGNDYFSEIPKIKWDPTNENRAFGSAYLDNYFSVFKTTNHGSNWSKPGIFGIPMWALDIDPINGDVYIGEFQNQQNSNIYKSYDAGNSWQIFGDIPGTAVWMIKTANDSVVTALSLDGFFGIGGIYRMQIPQLGFLAGQVFDSFSNNSIEFAEITVPETGDQMYIGNISGAYKMAMPAGKYNFTFKSGSASKTINDVAISAGDTTRLDVSLPVNIRHLTLNGRTKDDQENPVPSKLTLEYTSPINIPALEVVLSDENGFYQFDSLLSTNVYSTLRVEPQVLPYFDISLDSFELNPNFDIILDYADLFLADWTGDSNIKLKYANVLNMAGITWVVVDAVNQPEKISTAVLSKTKRKTLLWFARHSEPGINNQVGDSLNALLTGGYNIIMSGQNMLEQNASLDIFQNLGIGYAGDYSIDGFADPVNGTAGNAVGDGLFLTISSTYQGSADIINFSSENASSAFFYGTIPDDNLTAAVTINNTGYGAKAVIFGLDLDYAPTTRMAEIINRCLAYFDGVLSINNTIASLPAKISLYQNYPNPFNPETIISFELSKQSVIDLNIFTFTGQKVRTLAADKKFSAGLNKIKWDGKSDSGAKLASGIYFYNIESTGYHQTRKMVLIR